MFKKDEKVNYDIVYAIKDSLWAMINAKMFIKEEEGYIINRMMIEEIMEEIDTELAQQEGKEYGEAIAEEQGGHDCKERGCDNFEGGGCVMTEEESKEQF